jgi:hypothetical protein
MPKQARKRQIQKGLINYKVAVEIVSFLYLYRSLFPIPIMSDYFNPSDACPKSKELLFHSTVTTVRCGRCTLLNPNYIESPGKQPPIEKEVIEIDESPTPPTPIPPPQALPPAQRRGLATQIPSLPNFKLGYAEKERQLVDQRLAERKTKTSFIPSIPTVHFSVGIAHWVYDELEDDDGHWIGASNQWSVDEDNRELTSDTLLASLLSQATNQCKRPNLKKWLHCDGGDWSLGHTNPVKGPARDIAPWDQVRLLSTVIDSGAYEQKLVTGTARKLVFLWLYWTPEPPPDLPSVPSPRKATKKGGRKGVKKEKAIKAEKVVEKKVVEKKVAEKKVAEKKVVKTEPESTSKRSRAISGEMSAPKRVVTRLQIRTHGEEPTTDEDLLESGGEDLDDDEVAVN